MARNHLVRSISYSSKSSLSLQLSPQSQAFANARAGNRSKPIYLSSSNFHSHAQKEDIVIIGGGIAGLATAASLHRLGIRSLVLEQAGSLRTTGTSITLSKPGWKALDAIGVADQLRSQYHDYEGMVMRTPDGRQLGSLGFKDEDKSQEVRSVERKTLLQTLADQLPSGTIQFSSKLARIEKAEGGETLLELVNGTRLSAKIVIGCDGIGSPVAKWLGFREPKFAGHIAIRGLSVYPNGQPVEPKVNYIYGRGLRAGYAPTSATKIYWFIIYNSPNPVPRAADPWEVKKQALDLVKNWPSDLLEIIDHTDINSEETIIRSPLWDRWLWPGISPPPSRGGVVVIGDAWHPMTPNIAQGGVSALEDAIILSRKLSAVINSGGESIQEALKSFGKERWPQVFPLIVRANLVGKFLQTENSAICSLRENYVIPKLLNVRSVTGRRKDNF